MATNGTDTNTGNNGDMSKNEKAMVTRITRDLKVETGTKISAARIRSMIRETPSLLDPIMECGARVWRDDTWYKAVIQAITDLPVTVGRTKMSDEERAAKTKAVQKGILDDVAYYGTSLSAPGLHFLQLGYLQGMKGDDRVAGRNKFTKAVEKSAESE